MQRYAMIGPDNRPRRIVSGNKPHADALPVEYPGLPESRTTHHIQQNPPEQWDVRDDKVVVTYSVQPRNLENERDAKLNQAQAERDAAIQGGVVCEVAGQMVRFPMDEKSIARVDQAALDSERRPDGWKKRWRVAPGQWVELDADKIETVRAHGAEHVEQCFERFEAVEAAINAAQTLTELDAVSIRGYPEGLPDESA